MSIRPINTRGTARKIQKLAALSKQALRDGAYRVVALLHAIVLSMEVFAQPT
jgi:hypothetical protein